MSGVEVLNSSNCRMGPAGATGLLILELHLHLLSLSPVNGWAVAFAIEPLIVSNVHSLKLDAIDRVTVPLLWAVEFESLVVILGMLIGVVKLKLPPFLSRFSHHLVLVSHQELLIRPVGELVDPKLIREVVSIDVVHVSQVLLEDLEPFVPLLTRFVVPAVLRRELDELLNDGILLVQHQHGFVPWPKGV